MRKTLPQSPDAPHASSVASSGRLSLGRVAGGFLLGLVLLMANGLVPRNGETVAVLASPFAPPQTSSRLVAISGGAFEDVALAGRIVLTRSDDPGFIRTLYANGAVLVFNPRFLAGCRPQPSSSPKV